ncbi:MAG TPA: Gldg family protein, partial [Anaerolineae bacterium]|nr:Gldg family protein [Anaerolineae bacterium]
AAYTAIGLLVSSRTDNQIVSLILTSLLGGIFYLVGTNGVTGLVGDTLGEILRGIGTGSRFESIERGVVDLRDLIYYLSLTGIFLTLNVLSLDSKRWSRGPRTATYRRRVVLTAILVVANLALANAWLFPLGVLRADLTAGREYSLSPVTRDLVKNLDEPLLIRGYFSERTHPLLAPLVPGIRDMLREYEIVSDGNVEVEIVDPSENEELEAEANQVYGIRPSPFRVSDRYEASIINSYFDILVRYGDQHVTLGFDDLIEVQSRASGVPDVRLRNLEYDLTRSIKRVVYGFHSLDALFASLEDTVRLTALITPASLPEELAHVPDLVAGVAGEMEQESGGKFTYEMVDPDASNSPLSRETLMNSYGLYPISTSLFSQESYYLHLLLEVGEETQLLYLTGDLVEADVRGEIEASLKRAAPGFLKTVGVWVPALQPQQSPFGGTVNPLSSWNTIQEQLRQEYTVTSVDLTTGRVPGEIDVLLLIAPQNMTDGERFAIDQYLMRGGAVVVAAGNYALSQMQYAGLTVERLPENLSDMLAGYGVQVEDAMVLDPRNEPFPTQVQRNVGGMQVVEVQEVAYPFFVDVRSENMSDESPIVSNLAAVTMQWASPLVIDEAKNEGREVEILLESSPESWVSSSVDVLPQPEIYPEYGFPVDGEQKSRPLAVSIRGTFESYFRDEGSPFEAAAPVTGTVEGPQGMVETSPDSARLVVLGSVEFIDDAVLQLSQSLSADRYLQNLQLVQNAVDWAAEDEDLLAIRSRGTYARLLKEMDPGQESVWEVANYALVIVSLIVVGAVSYTRRRNEEPMELVDEENAAGGSHD